MLPGAITQYLDVPQFAVAAFFLFFILLVIHLRREDRREGYPLHDPADRGRPNRTSPPPKLFRLRQGGSTAAPHLYPQPPMRAERPAIATGNRLTPIGDPLLSAVGPAAYVMRSEQPFLDPQGEPELRPLRIATQWSVIPGDADPRGMAVLDAKRKNVGTVTDIWVDREVRILRYLEVSLPASSSTVMLPLHATDINGRRREVRVRAMLADQFLSVPRLAQPDQISAREEDQVNAYFAGGAFFNTEAGIA